MNYRIACLGGDGIGPEVVTSTMQVVEAVCARFGHTCDMQQAPMGLAAYRELGTSLPPQTVALCKGSDAILLGAEGAPAGQDNRPISDRAILGLRKMFGLACNLRPVKVYRPLVNIGPVRPAVKQNGVDFIVIRETSGAAIYSGQRTLRSTSRGRRSIDTTRYTEQEVRRVVLPAFELARARRKRLHLVVYSGYFRAGDLFRIVSDEVHEEFPDVELLHMNADNCAQTVVRDPSQFDVILFDDLFRAGMINDLGSVVMGSMGLLPSAELRPRIARGGNNSESLSKVFGLYEPVHGTASHRAGKDVADPLGTVLSAALMFRYSFGLPHEADAIERAVETVLAAGQRTYDIMEPGMTLVGCHEMGRLVAAEVAREGAG
jgi:3-isopropylmalate dehydrogenase